MGVIRRIASALDIKDVVFTAGLGLATGGIWQWSMPAALVACGVILMALCIIGGRRGGKA